MKEDVGLIVAFNKNGVIGDDNNIPWKMKDDMKFFKEMTTGGIVIMGRKTFESMGRVLPNRTNIIITRNEDYVVEGATVVTSLDYAMERAQELALDIDEHQPNIWIIGGAEIYKQSIDKGIPDVMFVTHIENSTIKGDTTFHHYEELGEYKIGPDTNCIKTEIVRHSTLEGYTPHIHTIIRRDERNDYYAVVIKYLKE